MSTSIRVIKNTGWLYAKMGITMFISLWTTRLILSGLGASDFGIFNVVGGVISMLGFLNAAMASATQRFMSFAQGAGEKEKQKVIFNVSVVLHLCIALVIAICLVIAGLYFFNGILTIPNERINAAIVVYISLIVSTLFTIMNVPYDAIMNAHENMKYFAVIGVFESILKLIVAFICIYSTTDKLILYGIMMGCIPIITLTIMKFYCHWKYEECYLSPIKLWDKTLSKEIISFAGWNFLFSGASMISSYGQGVILNSFFGPLLNAAQGITGQLNGQLQSLSSNFMKALNPVFAKSVGASNTNLLFKATWSGAKFSTALFLIVAIPFFCFTESVLTLWLVNVPDWTCFFVKLQLIRTFIEFMFSPTCSVVLANGNIKWFCIFSALFNALQLPVIYILFNMGFPPYVMYLVAILFGNVLTYVVAFLVNKRICKFSFVDYLNNVIIPIIFSILPAACSYYMILLLPTYKGSFIINMITIAGIYLISFYMFACKRHEKELIISLCKKIKKHDISCNSTL